MYEFVTAAEQDVQEAQGEEKIFEFSIAGQTFRSKSPTPGQINILFGARRNEGTQIVWRIFASILEDDGYQRLRDLVFENKVSPSLLFGGDELNSGGILDTIISEFAGRPTVESTTSSPSPPSAGSKSTGRSPGKGSTGSSSA